MSDSGLNLDKYSQFRVKNAYYKRKCKRLKNQIKLLIFENAALCDVIADVQAELQTVRVDRCFLLKRLMQHEGFENIKSEENSKDISNHSDNQKATNVPKKRGPKKRNAPSSTDVKTEQIATITPKLELNVTEIPNLPLNLVNILVHSMGEIIPSNPNFHNANWIYPVGYVATRIYAHPKDPQRKCIFTCKILNNAGMPQFQIIPDNDLDGVFFGESASICHLALLNALQKSLYDIVKLPQHVQGEKFFGFANPTVQTLFLSDIKLKQCNKFKRFLLPHELEYAVPEEKDPTMSYEALQSLINISTYHTMPEIKDEPPDELFELN